MTVRSKRLLSREQLSLLVVSLSLFTVLLVGAVFVEFFLRSVVFGQPRLIANQYTREDTIPLKIDEDLNFSMYSQSPDTSSHQGIARDQNYYYTFDTDAIYKFNLDWQKVSSSKKVNRSMGLRTNHLGDGEEHGGQLFTPIETYRGCRRVSDQRIAVFDAITLKYSHSFDVSAQQAEVSSLTIDSTAGTNGVIYVSSYCDGSYIWSYDLLTGEFLGAIGLSRPIKHIQGIAFKDGYFYITEDIEDVVWRVAEDGRVVDRVISYPARYLEGIDYTGDKILLTADMGRKRIITIWQLKTE